MGSEQGVYNYRDLVWFIHAEITYMVNKMKFYVLTIFNNKNKNNCE